MKESNNYIIYKVENSINENIYIGATTKSIEERKVDHIQRAFRGEKGEFQEAISTFGVDAFIWEQVDTASGINELAHKEKKYVIVYNTKEDGYNLDSGGGFKKNVYQYDLKNGRLLNTYNCLSAAGLEVKATKQQLSRACLSVNKRFKGFYWSYEYKEPFKPEIDCRTKIVYQIDSANLTVGEYRSISEASEITGINKSSIAKVCRQERSFAGGYNWRFK